MGNGNERRKTYDDGNRASMRAPASLGRGHALDSMHAALPPQRIICAFPPKLDGRILNPASLRVVLRHHARRPRGIIGIYKPQVHAQDVPKEEGRLGAADARFELH